MLCWQGLLSEANNFRLAFLLYRDLAKSLSISCEIQNCSASCHSVKVFQDGHLQLEATSHALKLTIGPESNSLTNVT